MAREGQRYEEEAAAVMTDANERLDAARANHDREVSRILHSRGRLPAADMY